MLIYLVFLFYFLKKSWKYLTRKGSKLNTAVAKTLESKKIQVKLQLHWVSASDITKATYLRANFILLKLALFYYTVWKARERSVVIQFCGYEHSSGKTFIYHFRCEACDTICIRHNFQSLNMRLDMRYKLICGEKLCLIITIKGRVRPSTVMRSANYFLSLFFSRIQISRNLFSFQLLSQFDSHYK